MIYHISGCGVCDECQHGYMISCRSNFRAAYGWQRDGGHAPYLLAEENTCIRLPDSLSYIDGALCACGFGTAYEALAADAGQRPGPPADHGDGAGGPGRGHARPRARGDDHHRHRPVGEPPGAGERPGTASTSPSRPTTAPSSEILERTGGHGCEVSIDCSGAAPARLLALQGTRDWGRCAYVGEGGTVSFEVSKYLIHKQITLFGSWVTSLKHMEELVERLDRWGIHPDRTCTQRLPLAEAAKAYELAAGGQTGKVCIVFED